MNVSSSYLYNSGPSYTIRLNDKEVLVVDEDPVSKAQSKARKSDIKKAQKIDKDQKAKKNSSPNKLSKDEKRLVKDLASRDTEVKAHELAHQSAGGGLTGAASYTYQQGPDGKMYAIGGEVSISTPSASTPEETIQNAKQIVASAMAAGDPSPQDFAVASSARMMEMKAMQQKTKEAQNKLDGQDSYKNISNIQNNQQNKLNIDISA